MLALKKTDMFQEVNTEKHWKFYQLNYQKRREPDVEDQINQGPLQINTRKKYI